MSGIERKKILWLSHLVPYPPKGGALQRSYNLLRELARYHDVHLFALVQPGFLVGQSVSVEEQLREAHEVLSEFCCRVEFVHLPHLQGDGWKRREAIRALFSSLPYTVGWLRSAEGSKLVREWARDVAFDVVHCDTISLVSLAGVLPNAKLVVNHHNIESHMMFTRAKKEKSFALKTYFYQEAIKILRYEKRVCRKARLNLTCSELDASRLLELIPGVLTLVVENGVDLSYFTPDPSVAEVQNSLIFAGGLGWYPNLDAMRHFATDIWPASARLEPELIMNLVGRGKDIELEKTASLYPGRFRLHGFVDDVRPYLSAAAVYVCPIRDGGGTKLKILDAMAMKRAIVAYPEACEGIDAEHECSVMIVRTPEEMVKVTIRLLHDDALRNELGSQARSLIERKYSFASIGQSMAMAYSNL